MHAEQTTNGYEIEVATETIHYESRDEAVAKAKAISTERGGRVELRSGDGRMQMQFRNGSLESYALQTRDRR